MGKAYGWLQLSSGPGHGLLDESRNLIAILG